MSLTIDEYRLNWIKRNFFNLIALQVIPSHVIAFWIFQNKWGNDFLMTVEPYILIWSIVNLVFGLPCIIIALVELELGSKIHNFNRKYKFIVLQKSQRGTQK